MYLQRRLKVRPDVVRRAFIVKHFYVFGTIWPTFTIIHLTKSVHPDKSNNLKIMKYNGIKLIFNIPLP